MVLLIALPCALLGQALTIKSVGRYPGDSGLAPGVLASLRYGPATTLDMQKVEVRVDGRRVNALDDESGDGLLIYLPLDMPVGPATVVLVHNGASSAPYPITLDPYAPGVYPPSRSLTAPYTGGDLYCNLPAMSGEVLSLFAVGLGAVNGSATVTTPIVTVSGRQATVLESVTTGYGGYSSGLYRVRFVVPPGDGLHLVSLSIAGWKSNSVRLPVGKAMLNLAPTFIEGPAAPDAIATAYSCNGADLSTAPRGTIASGDPPDLPITLAGATIMVRDSNGIERAARLWAATWNQVNYVIPAETALGIATVTAMSGGRIIAAGDLEVEQVAPSVFGTQLVRIRSGVQSVEPLVQFTVDLGPDSDQIYLLLYGTGVRHGAGATARVGDIDVPVEYAGPQGLPGLDQINLRLPRSLAGHGMGDLQVTVDGHPAHALQLFFK
jgi:uncharacterized protein (TIGR03437 family)